jgi:hypothetical protein
MQDASRPIWFKQEEVKTGEVTPQRIIQTDGFNFKNVTLLVATPVHSEVSIHYTESLLTSTRNGPFFRTYNRFLIIEIIFSYTR